MSVLCGHVGKREFDLLSVQLQEHEQIGETATDPKWAIAWKPAPTEAVTVIEDIVVSVGRSGAFSL